MTDILSIDDGKASPLKQIRFKAEAKLQDYLEQHPALIPVEDIDDNATPLLCIGKEVGVSSGSIDLLFIDKGGMLTVVETKLAKNPEARRTVVGQIIEYASYIYGWTAQDVYRASDQYFLESENVPPEYKGKSLDEVMKIFTEGEYVSEEFNDNIEQNLQSGKIRLLIAVDELVGPLRATVAFLNRNSKFDLLLLQVRSYGKGKKEVLIPTLFGQGQKQGPTASKSQRMLNEDVFLARCRENGHALNEELYFKVKALAERRRSKGDYLNWGVSGHSYRLSQFAELPLVNYANGYMSLWLYIPEKHPEVGKRYLDRLRNIDHFSSKIDDWENHKEPYFSMDNLTSEDIDELVMAIEELGEILDKEGN